jgi:hypothetical protein
VLWPGLVWSALVRMSMYVCVGICQAALPMLTGVLRDKGVEPRYLVGLASWQIALSAWLLTQIRGPLGAIFYGMNFGSVWGVKMTTTAMTYADFYGRCVLLFLLVPTCSNC